MSDERADIDDNKEFLTDLLQFMEKHQLEIQVEIGHGDEDSWVESVDFYVNDPGGSTLARVEFENSKYIDVEMVEKKLKELE